MNASLNLKYTVSRDLNLEHHISKFTTVSVDTLEGGRK